MDSHPQRGSVMSRHRWMSRCLIASTTVLMVAVGGSAALAQPIETTPAVPTTTQSAPAPAPSPDLVPLDAPTETTTTDPCAEPLTTPGATTTTTPATSTTPMVPPPPPCDSTVPAVPETSPAPTVTVAPETAPTSPATDNPVSTSIEPSTPATSTPETAPSAPGEKEPWVKWTPTENPNATIVPGKMRSDRQELPEGFTKEDADKAEILEAELLAASRSRTARSAGATNALAAAAPTDCMIYFPAWQYPVCGQIRVKYDSLGGPNSFLLLPTSTNITNPDGVGQRVTFVNGPIYWHPNAGAHPVVNHFMMKWGEHGWEAGWLGYPTTDEIVLQNGRRQEFQSGAAIYWSPLSLGIVGGAVRDKYNALGAETGPLGYPSTDEIWTTKYNGRYNNFLNGTITWSGQTGARVLYGAIRDRWATMGREDGELGYPISDELVAPDGIGHYAAFEENGSIYAHPLFGAWFVPLRILGLWSVFSYEAGRLGYPIAGPEVIGASSTFAGYLRQKFDKGVAIIDPNGKGVALTD